MSETQLLRVFVNERLAAAADEIFGLVEKTITEYQEEVVRSKREIIQLREQLSILKPPPEARIHRTEPHQLIEEHFPPPHDWNPVLEEEEDDDQDEPSLPQVKQEVMELNVPRLEAAGTSHNLETGYDPLELSLEAPPLSPDCSIANLKRDYDEEWQSGIGPPLGLIPTHHNHDALGNGPLEGDAVDICGVCGNSFESREILIDHLQTHAEVKFCHVCCACFSRDVDLIRHMHERHRGEKPFKCHECGKVFLRRDYLVVHVRTHTGEKPYRCSYCGKSFAQSAYLGVHKRIHTGEKPYCCTVCGRRFSSSTALNHCMKNHRSNMI